MQPCLPLQDGVCPNLEALRDELRPFLGEEGAVGLQGVDEVRDFCGCEGDVLHGPLNISVSWTWDIDDGLQVHGRGTVTSSWTHRHRAVLVAPVEAPHLTVLHAEEPLGAEHRLGVGRDAGVRLQRRRQPVGERVGGGDEDGGHGGADEESLDVFLVDHCVFSLLKSSSVRTGSRSASVM